MRDSKKEVMTRITGKTMPCECCNTKATYQIEYDEERQMYLCTSCRNMEDSIFEQTFGVKQAKSGSTRSISGEEINGAFTLGTQYDHQTIAVCVGDINLFRIHTNEIVKMMQRFKFKATKSNRYYYLELEE